MEAFNGYLRETLLLCGMLCLPVLGVATIIGTLIAVVQAATQVQEQTLSMLPKLIAVAVIVAIFGNVGLHACATLLQSIAHSMPQLLG